MCNGLHRNEDALLPLYGARSYLEIYHYVGGKKSESLDTPEQVTRIEGKGVVSGKVQPKKMFTDANMH